MKHLYLRRSLALLLAILLIAALVPPAFAEDAPSVSLDVSQIIDGVDSDGTQARLDVTATGLGDDSYTAYFYYRRGTGSYSSKSVALSNAGTASYTYSASGTAAGNSYTFYAVVKDSDGQELARSETKNITVVKPSISSGSVTTTDSYEGQSTGTITVAGAFAFLACYPSGKYPADAAKVTGTTVSGLGAGQYYVFVPAYSDGDTFYVRSSASRATVEETAAPHYTVTLQSDANSAWSAEKETVEVIQGSDTTLTYKVSATGDYLLDAVTAAPEANAKVAVTKTSDTVWTVAVSEIKGDVTVKASAKPIPEYTVTLAQDARVNWSNNGGKDSFPIKTAGTKSVYVKPSDSDRYYISGVTVTPEDSAEISYSSTGEVFVQNVTADVTLTPVVVEKSIPSTVEVVSYRFNENGIYSEENPYIQTTFTVIVKDQYGEIVPGTKVYFKDDEREVSATQTRTTGADGTAAFTYSYGISVETGATTADYNALFALDSAFTDALAEQDIHLVLQQKKDLVLYEHQIVGTAPGENNGKLIDLPEGYELWTGEVQQAALVIGSGEWIRAVDGQFTGLSAGQHILRAGAYVDEESNTFYFASDYADFFVPRGVWTVNVDLGRSQHVVFTGETEQVAEPGGTVYFYVTPEEGYEITEYTVDRPTRLSGGVRYSEENGFIVVDGVTGNVTLTVIAEQKEDPSPVYTILEGNGSTWTKGSSGDLHFKSDGPFAKFTGIRVDGETVNAQNYDASSGSTNVELKAAYLEQLTAGSHALTLEYTDGEVTAAFQILDAPAQEAPGQEDPAPIAPGAEPEPAVEPEPVSDEPAAETPEDTKPSGPKQKQQKKHASKSSSPKTADEGNIQRWALLAVLSLGGAVTALRAAPSRAAKKKDD